MFFSPVAYKKRRSGTVEYDYEVQAAKRAQKVRKVKITVAFFLAEL